MLHVQNKTRIKIAIALGEKYEIIVKSWSHSVCIFVPFTMMVSILEKWMNEKNVQDITPT